MRVLFASISLLCCISAHAMFVFDPTNYVENAASAVNTGRAYYQQIAMVKNQIQQLNNERRTLANFNFHHLSDYTQAATSVGNIAAEGNALTYASTDINDKFEKNFGSDDSKHPNYANKMHGIFQTVLDTSKGTLNSANKQMQMVQGETDGLNQIVNHSDSADGTKAVLQGTNQLLDANVAQLQSIKQGLSQLQSQEATSSAAQASQEEAALKADESFFNYQASYQGYQVDNRVRSIPEFK